MEECDDILIESKKSLVQRLKDEAKKKLKELKDKATNPETYVDSASKVIKNLAADKLTKVKQGKSLKSRKN